MINGFYQEPDTSHPPGEYRYLDARYHIYLLNNLPKNQLLKSLRFFVP